MLGFEILMASSLLTLVLTGGVAFAVSLLDTGPTTGTEPRNVTGTEQMTLKAQLKPNENEFLAKSGWYEIKKFGFVASNNSEICPSNDCKYTVENGQFSQSGGTYSFQGKLKVTSQEDDVKKSKFYNFIVLLDKTGEQESNGKILQKFGGFLGGGFGLGENILSPEIKYDITNATLEVDDKNPVLTIQGQRGPF